MRLRFPTNGVPWLAWVGDDVDDMRNWHCDGCGKRGRLDASSFGVKELVHRLGELKREHMDCRPSWWGHGPPDCPHDGCRRVEGEPCGHVGCPLNLGCHGS